MTQWAWHIHHDCLVERVEGSLKPRILFIKRYKPKKERATRLRLLKAVAEPLPTALVDVDAAYAAARDDADAAYAAADAAYNAAYVAYAAAYAARDAAYNAAYAAYDAARDAADAADVAYAAAYDAAYDAAHAAHDAAYSAAYFAACAAACTAQTAPEVLARHAVECPNCPWDGHTIFPQENENV